MFLGNDLVHWNGAAALEKETPSRRTARFIDRILHEKEHPLLDHHDMVRNRLVAVPLPRVRILWTLWAAKEAVFKAAMKAMPGLTFSPRSIRIEFLPYSDNYIDRWPLRDGPGCKDHGTRPLAFGLAYVRDQVYEILWEYHEEFVHALALGPLPGKPAGRQRRTFGDQWTSVVRRLTTIPTNRASVAVRQTALNLCRARAATDNNQKTKPLRIIRDLLSNGGMGPPFFHDAVIRTDLDLTLSHDGPWGAAGILQRPVVAPGRWKQVAPA